MSKYTEYSALSFTEVAQKALAKWSSEKTFEESISSREGKPSFVFYEGPPSANGLPGIHHVMGRSIKDIFCRYKTLKGFKVERKAGWDTHGLPVELGVEKALGITKEDIGKSISVDEYNDACKEAVMKYTDVWADLTDKMGYWVNMDDPYITYDNKYIESVWYILQKLYKKELLYKGYTIQPYSPKAGTGLSSHELNQPGCYRDVKDTSVTAQFKAKDSSFFGIEEDVYFLAWTTTPWTLPSNTALTVGEKINYLLVETFNQYTFKRNYIVLAENLLAKNFGKKYTEAESLEEYKEGDKSIPYRIVKSFTGKELVGQRYEQLMPLALPAQSPEDAFRIIPGDFVTTEDGTGIVHTAPTFGADDYMVAQKAGVPPMMLKDENGDLVPLVDLQGKFIDGLGFLSGKYVKNEYYNDNEVPEKSIDVEIAIQLKEENKAFKVEKYEHSYPHCWRTDKPVLYYPLDTWFVKSTAAKDKLIELNNTINWKPESTGSGRFGKWLENLNDWNLSRSRYWGIPIPIWRSEDKKDSICIGSLEELKAEIEKSVAAGFMSKSILENFTPNDFSKENYSLFDLHKHVVDDIILCSDSGQKLFREADLIDVWFDSGSMPYAQWHYPFENKEKVDNNEAFPADFIAEGVDQTRGWFFTLHAIATMAFDSVAYKNVLSNGLVLDKNGQKMSKRLGNAVDPFEVLSKYGPDATRWYMIGNANPWENLKFDVTGIEEVQRKFFRALHNTYSFFSLYANIDGFAYKEADIDLEKRPEIDRWVLSKLESLTAEVDGYFDQYEPTKAVRAIQDFVVNDLSNWYVRLCRKRFWRGDYVEDKIAAYQTLYTCLHRLAIICSPVAPFYSEQLFEDLNKVSGKASGSVHVQYWPKADSATINSNLEDQMSMAQSVCSGILSIRKKEKLRVRQPLQKALIPLTSKQAIENLQKVSDLIKTEVNIKDLEIADANSDTFKKYAKANFKALGPRFGKNVKTAVNFITNLGNDDLSKLEAGEELGIDINGKEEYISISDVEIFTEDVPGWQVTSENGITIALDITLTDELIQEGYTREMVNRIQNLRKDNGYEVTDRIIIKVQSDTMLTNALKNNKDYLCTETLADDLQFVDSFANDESSVLELDTTVSANIQLEKI
jgi:isoleucyl-tRNA synthetase